MHAPKITVIACTYNNADMVRKCLDSILKQTYKNFEVLCMEGMSKDNTPEVVREFEKKDKRVKVFLNKTGTVEGRGKAKWRGFRMADGEIVGVIDSDNILQDEKFFEKVVTGFKKEKNVIGVLGGTVNDRRDSFVVRFVSLLGTDPFFAYRSLDFLRNFREKKGGDYEIFFNKRDNMTLTGGNVFFYKKEDIESICGYDQDIISVKKSIERGKDKILIVNNATKHYTEKNMRRFVKKLLLGKMYFKEAEDRLNYLPTTKLERDTLLKNLIFNVLILPNFYYAFKIFKKSKDPVTFLFPFLAFVTTFFYGLIFLRQRI